MNQNTRFHSCNNRYTTYNRVLYTNFLTQVEEFCKTVYANHLNHPNEGVYLIWSWDWMSSSPPHEETSSWHEADNFTGSDIAHDDTTEEEEEPSLYTVRFKCIGATRDRGHQSSLEKANELMLTGKDVSVDLFFEPTNPVDAKAIAFKCLLDDNKWHRIGYVVKEALDDVHSALDSN